MSKTMLLAIASVAITASAVQVFAQECQLQITKTACVQTGPGPCTNVLPGTGCANVTYAYTIKNMNAITATNIVCTDDPLGSLGSIPNLAPGASFSPTNVTANVCSATKNTVTCTTNGVGPIDAADPFCQASARVVEPLPAATPVMSTWGLIGLAGLLSAAAAIGFRRGPRLSS